MSSIPFGWVLQPNGGYAKPKKELAPLPAGPRRVSFCIKVCPMGAVRMNRSDAWKKRPAVLRYFAFKDAVRAVVGEVECPDGVEMKFFIPMPDSWSKRKRAEMDGRPHRQKPDKDNCEKAVLDAILTDDSGVWYGSQQKVWCKEGEQRIELVLIHNTQS